MVPSFPAASLEYCMDAGAPPTVIVTGNEGAPRLVGEAVADGAWLQTDKHRLDGHAAIFFGIRAL
jgi:hypothetical protein